ncbi:unnamed protein product [Cylicocyclus nassatus]|uniref:Uncharacterized protein n=1 Tax=Cylicocyclus nassatus TaxID=53992 RepID=A0AA36H4F1_CYLNA|nr:unnamed protein product [Cylicocyclus nassatus]
MPQKSIKSSKLHDVTTKDQKEQEPGTPAVLQPQRDESPERTSCGKVILPAGSADVMDTTYAYQEGTPPAITGQQSTSTETLEENARRPWNTQTLYRCTTMSSRTNRKKES